ncbi:MAG: hypothetical protein NWF08_09225 [Candidatus Bathyarchaeota archaeon]|nr:hypothetical protein [Candidatus Bathyarchaeota archaeon]
MKDSKIRTLLILSLFSLIFFVSFPSVNAQNEFNCPILVNEVTLDGEWGEGEWDDAEELFLESATGDESEIGWMRVKVDESYFYAIVDFTSTSILVCGDGVAIIFDTEYNRGDKPQKDDIRFYVPCEGDPSIYIGTGYLFVWREEVPEGYITNLSFGPSPHSSSYHPIYEIRIPLSIFPQDTTQVGFTATAWAIKIHGTREDISLAWPRDSNYKVPDTYGEVNFPYPVHEFSSIVLIIVMTIGTSIILRKKIYDSKAHNLALQ